MLEYSLTMSSGGGRLIQEKATLEGQEMELMDAEERAREGLRLAEVSYREGVNTDVEEVDAPPSREGAACISERLMTILWRC